MKKVVFLSLLMAFIVVTSCSNKDIDSTEDYQTEEPQPNEEECDYHTIGGDNTFGEILFSLTEYNFGAEGGSVVITTEETFWWIEGVGNGIKPVDFTTIEFIREIEPGVGGELFPNGEIIKVKSDWFVITKKTSQKLVIEVEPNTLDRARRFIIGIQQSNLFLSIIITQSAE